ncbi:MAG: MarR family transcriptional regulator [Oscillospiraceae bacterium]|nr:MarR family transcriptional regulator [Oscillospiraceae bacterium]
MERKMPMGLRFSLLHRSFKRQLDARLQEQGLTGVQFGVLSQLRRMECEGREEINQRDLEEASHVTHPTMTEIVKRLEKQGFVRCEPSPRDGRCKSIRSTEQAASLMSGLHELDESLFRELSRALSPEELAALDAITEKLIRTGVCREKEGGEKPCD